MLLIGVWVLFCLFGLPNRQDVPSYSHFADSALVALGGIAVYGVGWVYYKFRSQVKNAQSYLFLYGRIIWPLTPIVIILDDLQYIQTLALICFSVIAVLLGLLVNQKNFEFFEKIVKMNDDDLRIINSIKSNSDVFIYDFLYWVAISFFLARIYFF